MAHGKFEFRGTGLGYVGLVILCFILSVLTLGLYGPWAYCAKQRWKTERTFIDGKQLTFKGTGVGVFGTFLLIIFLSIITFGIYIPWGVCRLERWRIHNTYFADTGDVENISGNVGAEEVMPGGSISLTRMPGANSIHSEQKPLSFSYKPAIGAILGSLLIILSCSLTFSEFHYQSSKSAASTGVILLGGSPRALSLYRSGYTTIPVLLLDCLFSLLGLIAVLGSILTLILTFTKNAKAIMVSLITGLAALIFLLRVATFQSLFYGAARSVDSLSYGPGMYVFTIGALCLIAGAVLFHMLARQNHLT